MSSVILSVNSRHMGNPSRLKQVINRPKELSEKIWMFAVCVLKGILLKLSHRTG